MEREEQEAAGPLAQFRLSRQDRWGGREPTLGIMTLCAVRWCDTWGDFTEYIPLVPGGHQKNSLFFINVLLKMTKCYESYMEKVIRKHTRQAPRQFIGPLRLWSP